jgi:hypothetical protein
MSAPRKVVSWTFALSTCVFAIIAVAALITDMFHADFPRLRALGIQGRLLQLIVIIVAACIPATFAAFLLQSTKGPLELSALGFNLKGTSGPILLWVVVFLAVSAVIVILLKTL